jgi:glucokinase
VAGVDLGGTKVTIGIVSGDGKILATEKRKTKATTGMEGVLDRVVDGLERACKEAGCELGDLDAVGIGAPSAVDFDEGLVIHAGNLGWKNVPLRALLEDRLDLPVLVDNDVNAAAWGEFTAGAARGWSDALGVWVGTGIGSGLILGGKVWRGGFHTAGELGQMVLQPRGGLGRRTVEEHCSRLAMIRSMETLIGSNPQSRMRTVLQRTPEEGPLGSSGIAAAYEAGDELVLRVVDDAADLLGLAIANAVTLLSVRGVVLGGGVTDALGKPFVERVRESFEWHVFPTTLRKCRVVAAELGDSAGIVGAAALARVHIVGGG